MRAVTFSEAESKRRDALEVAGPFATNVPADVRWLLCGRGRPVSAGSPAYRVVVSPESAEVRFKDIEGPRVAAEERFEEIGYTPVPERWYERPAAAPPPPDLRALRRALAPEELARYRVAGAEVAGVFVDILAGLRPDQRELEVAGALAGALVARGFTAPVVLVGGERRAPVYRHPLPTEVPLGRFALLAVTAERDGLHTSMTRIVSFGDPPPGLVECVRISAEVDAAVLGASRPGRTLGELFTVLQAAYARAGLPEEWRHHHQGGIAGYLGREVFCDAGRRNRAAARVRAGLESVGGRRRQVRGHGARHRGRGRDHHAHARPRRDRDGGRPEPPWRGRRVDVRARRARRACVGARRGRA